MAISPSSRSRGSQRLKQRVTDNCIAGPSARSSREERDPGRFYREEAPVESYDSRIVRVPTAHRLAFPEKLQPFQDMPAIDA